MSSALVRLTSEQLTVWLFRVLAWASVAWILGTAPCLIAVYVVAVLTQVAAHRLRGSRESCCALPRSVAVAAHVLVLLATFRAVQVALRRTCRDDAVLLSVGVVLVDACGGNAADPRSDLAALLYLVPVAGVSQSDLAVQEFRTQLARGEVTMASFPYGIRRIVSSLIKVLLMPIRCTMSRHRDLSHCSDGAIDRFERGSARLPRLSKPIFWVSGFSEIGIGLGRIVGFRLRENFGARSRPTPFVVLASLERPAFMTWLRELPRAADCRPTATPVPRLFLVSRRRVFLGGAMAERRLRCTPMRHLPCSSRAVLAPQSLLGLGKVVHRTGRVPCATSTVLLVVTAGLRTAAADGPNPLLPAMSSDASCRSRSSARPLRKLRGASRPGLHLRA